jgi:hypothetical protein
MATSNERTAGLPPDVRLGLTVFGLGALAALGSVLVAIGVGDVLAYVGGYRPSHWLVVSYAQALAVATVGWSLLVAVAFTTIRVALGGR